MYCSTQSRDPRESIFNTLRIDSKWVMHPYKKSYVSINKNTRQNITKTDTPKLIQSSSNIIRKPYNVLHRHSYLKHSHSIKEIAKTNKTKLHQGFYLFNKSCSLKVTSVINRKYIHRRGEMFTFSYARISMKDTHF